jgi:hypothetical protein
MTRLPVIVVFLTVIAGVSARAAAPHSAAAASPAEVHHPVEETRLTTVTLAPKAEQRLGIATARIERRAVERARLFGGHIVLPLTALPAGEANPNMPFGPNPPGSPTEVLKLSELQTLADGEVRKARVAVEVARIREARAEKLVESESGSQRDLDDARAATRLASASLEVAESRRALLGEPVEKMAQQDHAWVRVPVYVGDLPLLDRTGEAQVGGLGEGKGTARRSARLTAGPPSSDPSAATVDWYYQVQNEDQSLRLGQRVAVAIPMRGEEEALVVPWRAVIHDVQGGQWVYERLRPQTYARRRVDVERVVGSDAVLASGPEPGATVVTDGAAELFGTEFGAGH